MSSLYEALGHAEARGLAVGPETHYGAEHGSWLNSAEIEQSVLARQDLVGRIPTLEAMQEAATAWAERRNQGDASVEWQVTTADARINLKRLYPKLPTATLLDARANIWQNREGLIAG